MTEELSRTSALASRHSALGSGLEDWNGMGTAWSYHTNPEDEHDAVREHVGMFDMSPLKKIIVSGTDAAAVIDHLITRDASRIAPGQAAYTSVLTNEATLADDAIVYNKGENEWMIVHGSGDTMNLLNQSAAGKSVTVSFTDDLHDISVHEIFTSADSVGDVWDALASKGVMPCSFAALDKVRIEAGLLFYGYDMTETHSPYEVGLGFTVTPGKQGFRGATALQIAKGQEKIQNVCLDIDHDTMLEGGEIVTLNGVEVGVVNSPCYSHRLNKSLALAHITPKAATSGAQLNVSTDNEKYAARVCSMPIYDPTKSRTHE